MRRACIRVLRHWQVEPGEGRRVRPRGAILEGSLDGWAGATSSEGVSGLQGEDSEVQTGGAGTLCQRAQGGPVRSHPGAWDPERGSRLPCPKRALSSVRWGWMQLWGGWAVVLEAWLRGLKGPLRPE